MPVLYIHFFKKSYKLWDCSWGGCALNSSMMDCTITAKLECMENCKKLIKYF